MYIRTYSTTNSVNGRDKFEQRYQSIGFLSLTKLCSLLQFVPLGSQTNHQRPIWLSTVCQITCHAKTAAKL